MTDERIQALIHYFTISKDAMESLNNSDLFKHIDDNKKIANKMTVQLFMDTIDALKIALDNNSIRKKDSIIKDGETEKNSFNTLLSDFGGELSGK